MIDHFKKEQWGDESRKGTVRELFFIDYLVNGSVLQILNALTNAFEISKDIPEFINEYKRGFEFIHSQKVINFIMMLGRKNNPCYGLSYLISIF